MYADSHAWQSEETGNSAVKVLRGPRPLYVCDLPYEAYRCDTILEDEARDEADGRAPR